MSLWYSLYWQSGTTSLQQAFQFSFVLKEILAHNIAINPGFYCYQFNDLNYESESDFRSIFMKNINAAI